MTSLYLLLTPEEWSKYKPAPVGFHTRHTFKQASLFKGSQYLPVLVYTFEQSKIYLHVLIMCLVWNLYAFIIYHAFDFCKTISYQKLFFLLAGATADLEEFASIYNSFFKAIVNLEVAAKDFL